MFNMDNNYREHLLRTQAIVEGTLTRLNNMKSEFDAIINSPNEYSIQQENIKTLFGILGVEIALHKKHLQHINNQLAEMDARNEDTTSEETPNE